MCYLKITAASQAVIHKFANIKTKLCNCNSDIYFIQECLHHNIIHKYAKVKIPKTSTASNYPQKKGLKTHKSCARLYIKYI